MKCWKSSVRNWMRNHKSGAFSNQQSTGGMTGTNIDDLMTATPPVSAESEALEFMRTINPPAETAADVLPGQLTLDHLS